MRSSSGSIYLQECGRSLSVGIQVHEKAENYGSPGAEHGHSDQACVKPNGNMTCNFTLREKRA